MRQLRKFLDLDFSDRLLLVMTFTLLAVIRLGLWLLPFSTWHRLWSYLINLLQKSLLQEEDRGQRTKGKGLFLPLVPSPLTFSLTFAKSLMSEQLKLQPAEKTSVDKVIWAVSVASHYMPGGVKCLARALATQILLHWHGYPADLQIGVAKGEAGQLEAHAWVESQGQIVMGYLSNLSRFTPLPALGGSKR